MYVKKFTNGFCKSMSLNFFKKFPVTVISKINNVEFLLCMMDLIYFYIICQIKYVHLLNTPTERLFKANNLIKELLNVNNC